MKAIVDLVLKVLSIYKNSSDKAALPLTTREAKVKIFFEDISSKLAASNGHYAILYGLKKLRITLFSPPQAIGLSSEPVSKANPKKRSNLKLLKLHYLRRVISQSAT